MDLTIDQFAQREGLKYPQACTILNWLVRHGLAASRSDENFDGRRGRPQIIYTIPCITATGK